jgi:hypothetical protein
MSNGWFIAHFFWADGAGERWTWDVWPSASWLQSAFAQSKHPTTRHDEIQQPVRRLADS